MCQTNVAKSFHNRKMIKDLKATFLRKKKSQIVNSLPYGEILKFTHNSICKFK